MRLDRLWRVPACARLDRLWLALRNGVQVCVCMLAYSGVCWRMLTYADVCVCVCAPRSPRPPQWRAGVLTQVRACAAARSSEEGLLCLYLVYYYAVRTLPLTLSLSLSHRCGRVQLRAAARRVPCIRTSRRSSIYWLYWYKMQILTQLQHRAGCLLLYYSVYSLYYHKSTKTLRQMEERAQEAGVRSTN
jgi:hypothetical protein